MDKNRNWFGVDANNESSLFDYGFLMRYHGNDEYQVIYLAGYEGDKPLYAYGWFNPKEWEKDLVRTMNKNQYPDANQIASCCFESDGAEWLYSVKDKPQYFLSDILSSYTYEDVFGGNYYGDFYTVPQIRKRLNHALS